MTNWDKMKEMDIYEVAEMISNGCPFDIECEHTNCFKCWYRWLNTDITLKPCPFCGKRVAEVKTIQELYPLETDLVNPNYYSIRCNYNNGGCGSMLGGECETEEEAIKRWNTRYKERI